MSMLQSIQVKAARAMLDWTQEELSEASGISLTTIRSFEAGNVPRTATLQQIQHTFEKSGIEFTDGEGVRPRNDEVTLYRGADSCDKFMADIRQTIEQAGGDVIALLRAQEIGARPRHSNSLSTLEYYARSLGKLDFKCLLANVAALMNSGNNAQFRQISIEARISPSSYFVYGNKFALMMLDNRMNYGFTVFHAATLASSWRLHFASFWEGAAFVSGDNQKTSKGSLLSS